MKQQVLTFLLLGFIGFASTPVQAQTTNSIYNFGVWQTFGDPLDIIKYPEVKGRLCNFNWKDIEISNNVWVWDSFDTDLAGRVKDSLPVIFMIYTEESAPDWIYNVGVPKVAQNDNGVITYAPYYASNKYKNLFKRMITTVRQHVDTLPYAMRKWIIGVQGCFGSTGDYIGYKGAVDQKYNLSAEDFYNLFTEFSLYYYNEYLNTNPKIFLLSNPQNNGEDQMKWLIQNCPNSWIKCGSIGKGFQLNDEKTKYNWLFPLLNTIQNGDYLRARSELQFTPEENGWWKQYRYRNMFALMSYGIFWGLDWTNQSPGQIIDMHYDEAFAFYDKYAGQKNAATARNAMCVLRDGLDASDTIRFPVSIYGSANRSDTTRYRNIANKYAKFGARLEDPLTATQAEINNLVAKGINDVGWDVFAGNYERYLHQLKANETSVGYWNVNAPADSNAIHGKFARGINTTNGKDALYFDVDSLFLNKAPVNAAYPVVIDITYLDNGKGTFSLFYDAVTNTNKQSIATGLGNTGVWKKVSVTLYDAYFGNRAANASDFYIKAGNGQTVIFSVVELSRPDSVSPEVGFTTPAPITFDTTCIRADGTVKSFILKGSFLNGSKVTIGALNGFSYSLSADSAYTDSLVITNYGTSINQPIYVKFNPQKNGNYSGIVNISGGGYKGVSLKLKGVAINSRPLLAANISNVSCNNAKDGAIDLTVTNGTGPFTYSWLNDISSFKSSLQDISGLVPANYTVTVNSYAGCTSTATYTITQPAVLSASIVKDSDIVCKGGTTTVTVSAAGGTVPYKGTGVFTVESSNASFTVMDANGCKAETEKLSIPPGYLVSPNKPGAIISNDQIGICNGGVFKYNIDTVATATSYTWIVPAGTTIVKTTASGNGISLSIPPGLAQSDLLVTANNACGSSSAASKTITPLPANPAGINGPVNVLAGQIDILYKVVSASALLTYTWSSSSGTKITAGQNTPKATITWGLLDGRVTVKASNACGTSGPADLDVKIINALSSASSSTESNSIQLSSQFLIVPNPANDHTELLFNYGKASAFEMKLSDFTGKILWQKKSLTNAGKNREKINMQSYASGIYFVTIVFADGNRTTLKVLKQ